MDDNNHTPPETSKHQENDDFDVSKILEMAKLFSTFMNNDNEPSSLNNSTPTQEPTPIVYPDSSFLFDEIIHTPQMKVIKAAIPYMEPYHQKILGIFVKALEFNKVINVYNSTETPLSTAHLKSQSHWKTGMLNSIKPHCSEDKKCMLDMMIKVMDIGELLNKMKTLKIPKQVKEKSEESQKESSNQALIQTLSPLLNDNQKQMLTLLTTLME